MGTPSWAFTKATASKRTSPQWELPKGCSLKQRISERELVNISEIPRDAQKIKARKLRPVDASFGSMSLDQFFGANISCETQN